MSYEKLVCIRIREDTAQGAFHDAIYYTEAEYASKTEDEVKAEVQARADSYVAFVEEQSSQPAVAPTKEELEAQKEQLEAQLAAVEAAIAVAVAVPVEEPIEEEPINP